jgi:hypothetical protein
MFLQRHGDYPQWMMGMRKRGAARRAALSMDICGMSDWGPNNSMLE